MTYPVHIGPVSEIPSSPEIDLDAIRHDILNVVTQLRGLIGELRPPGLEEFGVVTAIEGYVSRLRREAQNSGRYIPAIYMDLPSENLDLTRPVALCLFRTTQEAIRNTLKHANASCINIDLQARHDEVSLSVSDDGDGFTVPLDFNKLTQNEHYGLIGIAERVEWVDGTLTVESQEGEGTELTVCIPLAR
jgi:signal transduction histidine kinase